ncbi:hypothetical protein ACWC0C_07045 [Streptomyces sp. NPDC001709]
MSDTDAEAAAQWMLAQINNKPSRELDRRTPPNTSHGTSTPI